ncbi:hypothetical protein, partial [Crystallibacter crystallopoietes]|uniref:hypothetical protein n=1 Tax=Crystallibacter crystallopoietes TaxID=37928 RepID=UPI00192BD9DE
MNDDQLKEYALAIPVDKRLISSIGRVVWAGIRLQHSVRDLLGAIDGKLSSEPFDSTLGGAITKLSRAAAELPEPVRSNIQDWCAGPARKAKQARDSVVHAIAFTAADGHQ